MLAVSPTELQNLISYLTPLERARLDKILEANHYDWYGVYARPAQQIPPGDWQTWIVNAGRGFGKTRTGAEFVRRMVESGQWKRVALVAETAADARDVMIEGESGLMAISPPWFYPHYEPSKRRVTWPNGAIATTYEARQYDRLRGPQHHGAWVDELAKMRYANETWDMLQFGLRLGQKPRVVVTTTPRAVKLIKTLMADASTVVTGGSSYDNRANLAPSFFGKIITKYEGTRLGAQEIHAKILEDAPGALWKRDRLDALRVVKFPDLVRIVVAVDPAASSDEDAAETGIIVAGLGVDGHGYVLDDMSLQGSPNEWGSEAVAAYHKFKADRIIGESNNGGEMVEYVIRTIDSKVSYKAVHASRGKLTRAEPIASLDEQGKIHHVGTFADLEDQQCSWVPGMKSPDRMDARVWAFTELMLDGGTTWQSVSNLGRIEKPTKSRWG